MRTGPEHLRARAAHASGGISDDPIYRLVLRTLAEVGVTGSVLDFGAGTGTLAERLAVRSEISEVTAIDLLSFPERREHPKIRWVLADLNEAVPLHDESFDAVVAAEVLEHLENPRAVARELFRVLRPGGTLLLTTPNNESWRSLISLIVRGTYVAFGDENYPAHIAPLLRADLRRIFAEAGFVRTTFAFTGHGLLPKLTSLTWQRISFGRLSGLRYSDNLLCVAARPAAGGG